MVTEYIKQDNLFFDTSIEEGDCIFTLMASEV